MQQLGFLLRHAPFHSAKTREGLDAILAACALHDAVRVFFLDDGVFNLITKSSAADVGLRAISKTFGLFAVYDIDDIVICQASLQARSIANTPVDWVCSGTVASPEEIWKKMTECAVLLSF